MSETVRECSGVALAVGSVRGVRTFNVDKYGRLRGVSHDAIWKPGENVATCRRSSHDAIYQTLQRTLSRSVYSNSAYTTSELTSASACPGLAHPKCACGFYAYHDGSRYSLGEVVGVIDGYGSTTIGTKGFRCEKARIVALVLEGQRERSRRELAYLLLGVLMCTLAGVNVAGYIGHWDRWYNLAAAVISFAVGILWMRSASLLREGRRKHNASVSPMRGAVVRNYPDVAIFDSMAAMVAEFPPDRGPEPDPTTDPEFWTRP